MLSLQPSILGSLRVSSLDVSSASERTIESLTFEDPSVLRGSTVWQLMHRGGRIFENSKGSAHTYDMGREVDKLDVFISHNWNMARDQKFLCLVLCFNAPWAFAAAIMGAFGTFFATLLKPALLTFPMNEKLYGISRGSVSSLVIGNVFFLLVLFFLHEWLYGISRCTRPIVFLDKICIHQTDVILQRKGISKLGAFLHNTHTFLVLYSKPYLRRLWTVYEMATFLTLNPNGQIVLVPGVIPKVLIAAMQLYFLFTFLTHFSAHVAISSKFSWWVVNAVAGSLPLITFTMFFRELVLEHAEIYATIDSFNFEGTECAVESDRMLVRANIVAFMKDFKYSDVRSEDHDVVMQFERLIRSQLPRWLDQKVGRIGIPYRWVLLIALPQLLRAFDHAVADIIYGIDWLSIVSNCVIHMMMWGSVFPNSLATMHLLFLWWPDRKSKFGERLIQGTGFVVCLVHAVVGWQSMIKFRRRVDDPAVWKSAVFVLFVLGHLLLTWAFFGKGRKWAHGCPGSDTPSTSDGTTADDPSLLLGVSLDIATRMDAGLMHTYGTGAEPPNQAPTYRSVSVEPQFIGRTSTVSQGRIADICATNPSDVEGMMRAQDAPRTPRRIIVL